MDQGDGCKMGGAGEDAAETGACVAVEVNLLNARKSELMQKKPLPLPWEGQDEKGL